MISDVSSSVFTVLLALHICLLHLPPFLLLLHLCVLHVLYFYFLPLSISHALWWVRGPVSLAVGLNPLCFSLSLLLNWDSA